MQVFYKLHVNYKKFMKIVFLPYIPLVKTRFNKTLNKVLKQYNYSSKLFYKNVSRKCLVSSFS